MPDTPTEADRERARDDADWLLDAIACSTQDRRFLRGEPEYDKVAGDAILLNAEKRMLQALATARREGAEEMRERAARAARSHHGAAAKKRIDRGRKLSTFEPFERDEIQAEERGEDIAADVIARAIRALPLTEKE